MWKSFHWWKYTHWQKINILYNTSLHLTYPLHGLHLSLFLAAVFALAQLFIPSFVSFCSCLWLLFWASQTVLDWVLWCMYVLVYFLKGVFVVKFTIQEHIKCKGYADSGRIFLGWRRHIILASENLHQFSLCNISLVWNSLTFSRCQVNISLN